MGSSNLAAAAVLEMTEAKLDKKLFLLDSTDPDALQELESRLPFERTLFVFSNKSGKRIETHALFLYLLLKVKAASGLSPGRHFIALTEEGSIFSRSLGNINFATRSSILRGSVGATRA